jgi:hypothetical protein
LRKSRALTYGNADLKVTPGNSMDAEGLAEIGIGARFLRKPQIAQHDAARKRRAYCRFFLRTINSSRI